MSSISESSNYRGGERISGFETTSKDTAVPKKTLFDRIKFFEKKAEEQKPVSYEKLRNRIKPQHILRGGETKNKRLNSRESGKRGQAEAQARKPEQVVKSPARSNVQGSAQKSTKTGKYIQAEDQAREAKPAEKAPARSSNEIVLEIVKVYETRINELGQITGEGEKLIFTALKLDKREETMRKDQPGKEAKEKELPKKIKDKAEQEKAYKKTIKTAKEEVELTPKEPEETRTKPEETETLTKARSNLFEEIKTRRQQLKKEEESPPTVKQEAKEEVEISAETKRKDVLREQLQMGKEQRKQNYENLMTKGKKPKLPSKEEIPEKPEETRAKPEKPEARQTFLDDIKKGKVLKKVEKEDLERKEKKKTESQQQLKTFLKAFDKMQEKMDEKESDKVKSKKSDDDEWDVEES